MTFLAGKQKKTPVGLIHNNILALPGGTVIGIVLGHCIFGTNGKIVAKYFLHAVYDLEGNILAKDSEYVNPEGIDITKMQEEGWKIIAAIEDHDCPRIKPHNKWSPFSLEDYFANKISHA